MAQTKPAAADAGTVKTEPRSMPSISAFTASFKKQEGFFNFYYDERSGRLYLEVDKWNSPFLYFSSLTDGVGNGGPERGQAASAAVQFVKYGGKVMLLQPNVYNYRAEKGNADEKEAVAKAFAQSVIWGFTTVAADGDKALIDITPFVVRDSQKIGDRLGTPRAAGINGPAGGGSGAVYRMDETRSAVNTGNTKNFPLNTEFEALVTLTGGNSGGFNFGFSAAGIAPDPSAVTVRMHQSFVALPDSNYHPRRFDPRSGLFAFTYLDFSAGMDEPLTQRFTRRHRLQKKDPSAAVSEPVKPIVYYIDRGAPPLIKQALIEGGSWWNQAFEAAGYKNAFIVKELPEGADPMDIRYNVVNWVDRSGSPQRAFSFGSSYIDPRTGEIIKGVVTLGSDRHRQDYLIAEGLLQPYQDGKPVPPQMQELALARIRQLSAHEIGHTLGMYHNFAASVKERASVMDYPFPRFTLKTDGTIDVSDAYAKGIGSWDKRAIIWGYQDFAPGTDENTALDKIMQETLQQGFVFIPDIGGNVHPLSHQWDDGKNAIDELNRIMTVRRYVLDHFSEKAIPANAPMSTLEEVLVPMYLLHRYSIEAAAKSIGGLYFTHALKNDGQTVTQMIDPAEQQKALKALLNTLTPEALALPESLIQKIPPRPVGYPSGIETFASHTGVTFDPIGAAETAASTTLSYLLDAERAARLIEFQSRNSAQPGFIAVADAIIAQSWKASPVAGYKGQLQTLVNNLVLKYLLQLAANTHASEIVRGQALLKIDDLKKWMTATANTAAPAQKANLLFGLSQIEEFKSNPNKYQPPAAAEMPPGAPIGMPDDLFDY